MIPVHIIVFTFGSLRVIVNVKLELTIQLLLSCLITSTCSSPDETSFPSTNHLSLVSNGGGDAGCAVHFRVIVVPYIKYIISYRLHLYNNSK